MGWNWALFLCQAALLNGIRLADFAHDRIIEDGKPGVVLRPSGTNGREDSDRAAVAYVDNYACLSSVEAVAQKGRDAITGALEGAGLVVHDL